MGFTWCPLWSAGLHFFHLGLQGQPRVRRSLVAWCFHSGFLPWNIRNIYEIYVPIYEMWISMKVKPAVEIPAGSKASKPSNIWGYLIFFLVENLWVVFPKDGSSKGSCFLYVTDINQSPAKGAMSPCHPPYWRGQPISEAATRSLLNMDLFTVTSFLGLNPAVFWWLRSKIPLN